MRFANRNYMTIGIPLEKILYMVNDTDFKKFKRSLQKKYIKQLESKGEINRHLEITIHIESKKPNFVKLSWLDYIQDYILESLKEIGIEEKFQIFSIKIAKSKQLHPGLKVYLI